MTEWNRWLPISSVEMMWINSERRAGAVISILAKGEERKVRKTQKS